MFGPKELDLRNTYNPDLSDIQESLERTYEEANCFYNKEKLYLKDVERRILFGELSSEKNIYDECHAIASDLAKCCEMYLKALYIYENNIPGTQIDELWKSLKKSDYKHDEKGNLIYKTTSGEITFVKYDEQGKLIKDANGNIIYFDKNNNTYNENNRGSKIKTNGHQLDRLIDMISLESKMLLEARMLTISMETTEENQSVSIYDLLLEKNVLKQEKHLLLEQYEGWIEQHKRTFEEARYSGEKNYSVNIEFLYHLATQIKAVVQYRIAPKNDQKFTLTDEELSKIPNEITNLALHNHYILSEQLIKLILDSEDVKQKMIDLFSIDFVLPKNISSNNFYDMIKLMDKDEITSILYIGLILENYEKFSTYLSKNDSADDIKKIYIIARVFKYFNIDSNKLVGFCCNIKSSSNIKINSELFINLFKLVNKYELNNHLGSILKDSSELINKFNKKQENKKHEKYNIKF